MTAFLDHRARTRRPETARRAGQTMVKFARFISRTVPRKEPPPSVLSRALVEDFFAWLTYRDTDDSGNVIGTGLHGKARAVSTARKDVSIVMQMWSWAFDRDEYDGRIPRPRRIDMPEADHQTTEAPTWAEMDLCISLIPEHLDDARRGAILGRFTGLRRKQIAALEWSFFDLDKRLLYFPGELGKSRGERRGRVIPLSPHLVEIMATWGAREGYLIRGPRSARSRANALYYRHVRDAWAESGVRREKWLRPTHAFRAGLQSGLKALGADDEAVRYLVGHELAGVRSRYIDAVALPLEETVALIPPLGGNVVALSARRGRSS